MHPPVNRQDPNAETPAASPTTEIHQVHPPVANHMHILARQQNEDLYRAFVEAMNEGAVILAADGTILYCNPRFAEMIQLPTEKVQGQVLDQFIVQEDRPQTRSLIAQAIQGTSRGEICLVTTDQEDHPVHISLSRIRKGTPISEAATLCLVATDVGERKRAERQTNDQLKKWISQLELMNQEITLVSEMVNLFQACRTPKEAYSVIAQYTQQLFPDEAGALYVLNERGNLLERAATWGGPPTPGNSFEPAECWALRRGRLFLVQDPRSPMICSHRRGAAPASYLCVPMMAQGETLGLLTLQSRPNRDPTSADEPKPLSGSKQQLAVNVAEYIALALANLQLRQALHQQAIRDPLTNLYNRRYMEETLERELFRAKREHTLLAIIMLDIDRFKEYNDTYGHEAGDMLLREVARFLKTHIRREDVVCRYGGEEFTLILPEETLERAKQRAEILRTGVHSRTLQYQGQSLDHITLSFGIAVFPQHGSTVDDLLRAADRALYRAKAEGRDRVVIAEDNAA